MFLIAKVIGLMLVVGVPTSIGGIQLYLKNKTISTARSDVQKEINKTAASIQATTVSFTKEINRIKQEKNELATTKNELTYVPVKIQEKIDELTKAKSTYETKHTSSQDGITKAISTHKTAVEAKKTEIEELWTNEKTRVDVLKKALEGKIQTAKTENEELQKAIDKAKEEIEEIINKAFITTTGP